jgi:hypothetical protein
MLLFEYEPFFLSPKPKILNEEENKGGTNGVGPLSKRISSKGAKKLKRRKG